MRHGNDISRGTGFVKESGEVKGTGREAVASCQVIISLRGPPEVKREHVEARLLSIAHKMPVLPDAMQVDEQLNKYSSIYILYIYFDIGLQSSKPRRESLGDIFASFSDALIDCWLRFAE